MSDGIRVDDRQIGVGERAFIVAEIGSNHDQKVDQARRLIEAAAGAGADAVKFQLFSADLLYPDRTGAHSAFKAVELDRSWVPELAAYSKEHGVLFFASPFDNEAVNCLEAAGVPAYKVASSEAVNLSLLKHIAATHKPVLISTGMCDLADIHEAIEVIRSERNNEIILLQCTSLYPTEPKHVHLRVMDTLRAAFQLPVGLSDHTLDIIVAVAAVSRGACVVEKHLTLNRELKGPDHGYALEPEEFKRMVQAIRTSEEALGSPVKKMLPEEAEFARRESIRAARDIRAGEMLTRDLLVIDRPAVGIGSRFLAAVIGRKSRSPIAKGEAITWDKI